MAAILVLILILFHIQWKTTEGQGPPIKYESKKPGYHKDGDIMIGGIVTIRDLVIPKPPSYTTFPTWNYIYFFHKESYYDYLAFVFAVEEINNSSELLPNITLGFHLFESYLNPFFVFGAAMSIFTGMDTWVPNYRCKTSGTLAAIIEGLTSQQSSQMSNMFRIFHYPQISFISQSLLMSDTVKFPFLYRTVPNELHLCTGIIKSLKHFDWTWVGIIASNDFSSLRVIQILREGIEQNGGCIAFIETFRLSNSIIIEEIFRIQLIIYKSSAKVIILYANAENKIYLGAAMMIPGKVLITKTELNFLSKGDGKPYIKNNILSFSVVKKKIPSFTKFIQEVNFTLLPSDHFTEKWWLGLCDSQCPKYIKRSCSSDVKLSNILPCNNSYIGKSSSVYNAVYALAHALHDMLMPVSRNTTTRSREMWKLSDYLPWKLHHYLKNVHFKNNLNEEIFFDENRDLNTGYNIINQVYLPNGVLHHEIVGSYNPYASQGQDFIINEKAIVWERLFTQTPPQSKCSESCPPGFRKSTRERQPTCCFDCIPCPQGEISNQSDMDNCVKCREDHWPNHKRDTCILKPTIFLSYEEVLGMALATSSIFFFLINTVILGIFIIYRDTSIVRANNRGISFILLISLMICFLCSLMFIGHPEPVTCILRSTTFGMTFSISLSSILAKTITVVMAFHATKPGSKLRKWMGSRISYTIILSCSLFQFILCLIWLFTAPPFPYLNMQSETGAILLECNEGSMMAFYCVLGFLGFLAGISFIIAFLSRNLPDSFNEAKYITFSMLVFCSVWITFIPTYLSTRGKYMVAVEIFAIQASSAGLLGCIFMPKCCIIFLRPEMNSRKYLTKNN
ncbi:vomeronasal type-2 receptor 26-like [Microcaecilia unicolor]|uniref:Vomeronasal type-2 receptor 26-like n=1 Tax=Microcaecilia unicolor TaxID=1415580 RepID=A0A6P7XJY1_9AMPH|nr:vomeronasal type-2 receptor 26-like [Microcaecilia unicolor]